MSGRKIQKLKPFKWFFPLLLLLVIAVLLALFLNPFSLEKSITPAEKNYIIHCGSCHLVPDPRNIPKSIWENNVLLEMAARMGYGDFGKGKEYYPKESTIDSTQWNALTDYVLNLAPESVPNDPTRKGRNGKLVQFDASLEIMDNPKLAGAIVNVSYDSVSKKVFMGNVYGSVVDWKKNPVLPNLFIRRSYQLFWLQIHFTLPKSAS